MEQAILRVTCIATDAGDAIHIGGPANVRYKSFDLPAPPELIQFMAVKHGYMHTQVGPVELIEIQPPAEMT